MILYANGDSHSAGAEAVNSYAFAEDDRRYELLKRAPHPDNIKVAWSTALSDILKMTVHTDAESASSNTRIIRTTKEWLDSKEGYVEAADIFIVIQWSTWEREEWLIDGEYFQVNASGIDDVPESHKEQYKEFVAGVDWGFKTRSAFKDIIAFHKYLSKRGIKHLFFNGNNTFMDIPADERYDFNESYINPYLPEETFNGWLQVTGYNTVSTSNYHYGAEAHAAWARRISQHITDNSMV